MSRNKAVCGDADLVPRRLEACGGQPLSLILFALNNLVQNFVYRVMQILVYFSSAGAFINVLTQTNWHCVPPGSPPSAVE